MSNTISSKISDSRIISFLRSIKNDPEVDCVKNINEDLDNNKSLKEIFEKYDLFGKGEYGFFLDCKKQNQDSFKIDFYLNAGPMAANGGTWKVKFQKDSDEVIDLERTGSWIS